MINKIRIAFFFPYKHVSGVPVLFARLAEEISHNDQFHVSVIDYPDGAMARLISKHESIHLIDFFDNEPLKISAQEILILQAVLPYTLRRELKIDPEAKIVYWVLFHLNLVPAFIPIRHLRHLHVTSKFMENIYRMAKYFLLRRLSRTISEMHQKGSIFFMDSSNLAVTQYYLQTQLLDPVILPICIDPIQNPKTNSVNYLNGTLNLGWVGRVEDFKTNILLHTIKEAARYANVKKKSIDFYVIGYGNDLSKLQPNVYNSKHFELKIMGKYEVNELSEFLTHNIDMLLAMGTAALEGGKLGIPTILLDATYKRVPRQYRYRWLYESDGANVGRFIEFEAEVSDGHSFGEIIEGIGSNANTIGLDCYSYVKNNHDPSLVAAKMLSLLRESSFVYGDFGVNKKSIIRRIYDAYRF